MKDIKGVIIFVIIFLLFFVINCTNVTQVKLKENPEFEKNAERYKITTPLNGKKFTIEEVNSGKVYSVEAVIENSNRDIAVLDEEERDDAYVSKTKTFASHKFFVTNPWDSIEYEVIGTTTYFITKEEEEGKSFEVGKMEFPVEFWIFDEGKEFGKISIPESPAKPHQTIDLTIHEKPMELEYSIYFKGFLIERCFSFEDENGLITLINLQQKSSQHVGEMLIKQSLSSDLKSDIVSLYMIVETALSIISAEKI
jgi:hypothetical protein